MTQEEMRENKRTAQRERDMLNLQRRRENIRAWAYRSTQEQLLKIQQTMFSFGTNEFKM